MSSADQVKAVQGCLENCETLWPVLKGEEAVLKMTDTVLAFIQMRPEGKASKAACCGCQPVRARSTLVLLTTLSQVCIRAECSWEKGGGRGGGLNMALLVMNMMRCVRGLTWSVKHSFAVLRL